MWSRCDRWPATFVRGGRDWLSPWERQKCAVYLWRSRTEATSCFRGNVDASQFEGVCASLLQCCRVGGGVLGQYTSEHEHDVQGIRAHPPPPSSTMNTSELGALDCVLTRDSAASLRTPVADCESCGKEVEHHSGSYGANTVEQVFTNLGLEAGDLVVCPSGDVAGLILSVCARMNLKYTGNAYAGDGTEHYKCILKGTDLQHASNISTWVGATDATATTSARLPLAPADDDTTS